MVVNLGDGGQGAARPGGCGVLGDTQSRRQAVDEVAVGPLKLVEQGSSVAAERFQKAALPLRMEGVEGQGAFARAAGTGYDAEAAQREIDVYIVQVMRARPAHPHPTVGLRHG